ncbi:DUF2304 domain-containing protein [Paenibacillus pasadenensis]|uniref:DUF2304 domain-containing protein n=1 Tax=Paenibacillus pasadenensis TaxID=217090 RepID=UPI000C7BACD1|nr:DUF2304 domain-containing protein [Paenibacillus pasadenensis]
MIPFKLQIILIAGSFLFLLFVINMIRRYKLELRYSMLWLILGIIFLILALIPSSFSTISKVMGIELPVNALFLITIFGNMIIIFYLTLVISKQTIKLKEISQEIGIFRHEYERLKEIKEECDAKHDQGDLG